MAKILMSIPEPLLEEIDTRAKALGESRSGYLRGLAEQDLEDDEARRQAEFKRLMDLIRADFRDDEPFIDAAELIRKDRGSH